MASLYFTPVKVEVMGWRGLTLRSSGPMWVRLSSAALTPMFRILTRSGGEFTGHRIRASDGEYGSRDGAVRAIQGLAPGQRVAVYFDPDEPARSVLRPGAGSQEYIQLLVSVVMFSLGFALVLALWRSRGQRSETGANAKATSPRAMTSA
jgi:hypothetical protein